MIDLTDDVSRARAVAAAGDDTVDMLTARLVVNL